MKIPHVSKYLYSTLYLKIASQLRSFRSELPFWRKEKVLLLSSSVRLVSEVWSTLSPDHFRVTWSFSLDACRMLHCSWGPKPPNGGWVSVDSHLRCCTLGEAFQCKNSLPGLGNVAELFHGGSFLCFLSSPGSVWIWNRLSAPSLCFPSPCQSLCILALLPRRFPQLYFPIFQYNCYVSCFDF